MCSPFFQGITHKSASLDDNLIAVPSPAETKGQDGEFRTVLPNPNEPKKKETKAKPPKSNKESKKKRKKKKGKENDASSPEAPVAAEDVPERPQEKRRRPVLLRLGSGISNTLKRMSVSGSRRKTAGESTSTVGSPTHLEKEVEPVSPSAEFCKELETTVLTKRRGDEEAAGAADKNDVPLDLEEKVGGKTSLKVQRGQDKEEDGKKKSSPSPRLRRKESLSKRVRSIPRKILARTASWNRSLDCPTPALGPERGVESSDANKQKLIRKPSLGGGPETPMLNGELMDKLKKWKESAESSLSPTKSQPSDPPPPLPEKPAKFKQKQLRALLSGELQPPRNGAKKWKHNEREVRVLLDRVTIQLRFLSKQKSMRSASEEEALNRLYDKPRCLDGGQSYYVSAEAAGCQTSGGAACADGGNCDDGGEIVTLRNRKAVA